MADFEGLDADIDDLGVTVDAARDVTRAFSAEIETASGALKSMNTDIATLEKGLSGGLRKAFDGVVFKGFELSDALRTLGESISKTVFDAAITPVTDGLAGAITGGIGGLFGVAPFANGAGFIGGKVTPFAKGGVVAQATAFPMRGGVGLMGEAGPEAIMPLSRGADGALGVRMQGAAPTNVTINVTTPDVQGFQRSSGQIAAQLNRALARGQRNA